MSVCSDTAYTVRLVAEEIERGITRDISVRAAGFARACVVTATNVTTPHDFAAQVTERAWRHSGGLCSRSYGLYAEGAR